MPLTAHSEFMFPSIDPSICDALFAPCRHTSHIRGSVCLSRTRGPSTHTTPSHLTDRQTDCSDAVSCFASLLDSWGCGRRPEFISCAAAAWHSVMYTQPHTLERSAPALLTYSWWWWCMAVVGRLAACGACALLFGHLCCLTALLTSAASPPSSLPSLCPSISVHTDTYTRTQMVTYVLTCVHIDGFELSLCVSVFVLPAWPWMSVAPDAFTHSQAGQAGRTDG